MGADYTAYAVIGVRVTNEQLTEKREIPSCSHLSGTHKFCPECGKRVELLRERVLRPFCETDYPDEGISGVKSVRGLQLFSGTDHEPLVLGYGACSDETGGGFDDDPAPRVDFPNEPKRRIKEALEPIGLWDEKEFGLWAILYCSY